DSQPLPYWELTYRCTNCPSVSSSLALPQATPTTTFVPPIVSSYSGCIIDPQASNSPFELLDANTALPIIDNGGIASLPTEVIDNVEPFSFLKPPNGPAGVYDIVLDHGGQTLYFAVFASGKVGFTTSSSNGQTYVPQGDDKYITTVFAVA